MLLSALIVDDEKNGREKISEADSIAISRRRKEVTLAQLKTVLNYS